MSRYVNIEPYDDCKIVLHKEDAGIRCRDLPTADVEEVVRCKDCLFVIPSDDRGKCYCKYWKTHTKGLYFCSRGARLLPWLWE